MPFTEVLVLGVSTNTNAGLVNWRTSLRRHGLKFEHLGHGVKWAGFIETRVRLLRDRLRQLIAKGSVTPSTLVMCVDTNDIVFTRGQEAILAVANKQSSGSPLLLVGTDFGATKLSAKGLYYAPIAETLRKQTALGIHTVQKTRKSFRSRKFALNMTGFNGGSICGDARSILFAYEWIMDAHDNKDAYKWKNDDQGAWRTFAEEHPTRVKPDINQSMFRNICTIDTLMLPAVRKANKTSVLSHFVGMGINPVLVLMYNKHARQQCGNDFVPCVWNPMKRSENKAIFAAVIVLSVVGIVCVLWKINKLTCAARPCEARF